MAQQILNLPSDAQIWDWLDKVPDPEIPVVSVVDLGIVRNVAWEDNSLIVEITPTYSGCPATGVIALDIETALLKRGLDNIKIRSVLSPAWTTSWISQRGREKLKAYGIVPPVEGDTCAGMISLTGAKLAEIDCPRCESSDIERISQFGSTPCKASYRCKSCLEPFDYFKAL
ncbi:MAG: 1,2-phenylacetyl-CoA epoxidase subunit PaaD [Maricaulaceae bacterium]